MTIDQAIQYLSALRKAASSILKLELANDEWWRDFRNSDDKILPWEIPKTSTTSGWMRNEREAKEYEARCRAQ